MIEAGQCEGQAIKGKVQLGETPNGTLQIAIDMELFRDQNLVWNPPYALDLQVVLLLVVVVLVIISLCQIGKKQLLRDISLVYRIGNSLHLAII